jgi:hypothetical protein
MKFKSIFFALIPILFFTACKDNDQVGSSIQPDGDLLKVNSNRIDVESSSLLVDYALSKSSHLFFGRYIDDEFGQMQVEFMSQIDSRLGFNGLTIPDTTVASRASGASGIPANILTQIDSNYGPITKISSPKNVRADSVFFVIAYSNEFFGDSTALQSVDVYALNKTLEPSFARQYFTNTDVSEFCKKDTLLGSSMYRVRDGREIRVKLNNDFGERLAKVYQKGSNIDRQAQFNEFFKGVYVSHSFNGECIVKVEAAGIMLYYSYDADITTTYNGVEVTVNSASLSVNPLVSSVFLSANRAVERVNLINQVDLKEKFPSLQNRDVTYTYTPAGMYTAVNIPFQTMVDLIKASDSTTTVDTDKIMFNSARLTLYTKKFDREPWRSATPNPYMLLLHQDSVVPFFHKNKSPDGMSSFVAAYNSTTESYTFDVTRAVQKKLSGQEVPFSENMVLVPIALEQSDGVNFYRQELWVTTTMLYGSKSTDVTKQPRLDMVYTRWR